MSGTLADDNEAPYSKLKETATEYQTHTRAETLADLVNRAQLVIGADGQPSAMQIDIADWSALMEWLEDVEDAQLMR